MKSGSKTVVADETAVKENIPKWDYSKLKAGDWFSGTSYYQVDAIQKGGEVDLTNKGQCISVTGDLLETEMNNSSVYDSEEALSLTKVAELLTQANTKCFTVTFNTKTDSKAIADLLSWATAADLKNSKTLAKQLLLGKRTTIVGRLANSQGKLGRSLVVDLTTEGFKQVDHRHLISLILNNVKYTVK